MNQATADDLGKLILRFILGILILLHGISKIKGGIGPIEGMVQGMGLPGFVAYGVYIGEVVAPVLLIIGFYGRVGALLIAANMTVAIYLAHQADLLRIGPQGGWALELQGMYLFTALALALLGPGRMSINRR
jgi:putative oxidoreductase